MKDDNDYIAICKANELVATASLEKDFLAQNAEIVAIAVLPEYRGKSFPNCLIKELEKILKRQNYKTI